MKGFKHRNRLPREAVESCLKLILSVGQTSLCLRWFRQRWRCLEQGAGLHWGVKVLWAGQEMLGQSMGGIYGTGPTLQVRSGPQAPLPLRHARSSLHRTCSSRSETYTTCSTGSRPGRAGTEYSTRLGPGAWGWSSRCRVQCGSALEHCRLHLWHPWAR